MIPGNWVFTRYLAYLRDRLVVARELLTESGSIFVQIGDENVHLVRSLLDEVFGAENVVAHITFATTTSQTSQYVSNPCDYLLWYCKSIDQLKFREMFLEKTPFEPAARSIPKYELPDGTKQSMPRKLG